MYGCAHQQESFLLEESICSDSQFFPLLDYKTSGYIQRNELIHIGQNLDEKNFKASDESNNIQIGYFNFYKEKIGNPPFQFPAELLCQTLKFTKAADAEGHFIRGSDGYCKTAHEMQGKGFTFKYFR